MSYKDPEDAWRPRTLVNFEEVFQQEPIDLQTLINIFEISLQVLSNYLFKVAIGVIYRATSKKTDSKMD